MSQANRIIAVTELIPVVGCIVAMVLAFRLAVPNATYKVETAFLITVVLAASFVIGLGLLNLLERLKIGSGGAE